MSRNQIIIVVLVIAAAAVYFASLSGTNSIITGSVPQGTNTSPTPAEVLQTSTDASITLRDVSGGSAVAEGSRKLAGKTYNIGVRAEKLPPLSPGKNFRVWLVRSAGSYTDALALDILRQAQVGPNRGDYVLGISLKEDARIYKGMIITLQPVSDSKPSNVILEGVFR